MTQVSKTFFFILNKRVVTNSTSRKLRVINFLYALSGRKKYFKFRKCFVDLFNIGEKKVYFDVPLLKDDGVLIFLFKLFNVKFEKHFSVINTDIVLYDSIFPARCADFRCVEYLEYFKHFKSISCLTSKADMHFLGYSEEDCREEINRFNKNFGKTVCYDYTKIPYVTFKNSKVLYTNFLRHIYEIIDDITIPFAFCLYPRGAFALDDENTDKMCAKVFSSKYFRKVIVTTKIAKDYLLYKNFVAEKNIVFIPGGVMPVESLLNNTLQKKKFYKEGKTTFDIAFFARRQSAVGEDKGYDAFVKIASTLMRKHPEVRAHVCGSGWDKNTYPIDEKALKNFTFYGWLSQININRIFKKIDVIISPNKAFVLYGSNYFDGFPTGCVVEAMLHGVVALASDPLNINPGYVNHKDMEIIDPLDIKGYVNALEGFIQKPERLRLVATNGMNKTRKINSYETQILPRIKLLEEIIGEKQ